MVWWYLCGCIFVNFFCWAIIRMMIIIIINLYFYKIGIIIYINLYDIFIFNIKFLLLYKILFS